MPSSDLRARALDVLSRHWGYPDFRGGQWEAVEAVLSGSDALIILPTGGGKSLCYQVPALMQEGGLTLVISPLIALMQDQVAGLERRGIPATFVNSTLPHREIDQRLTDAEFGRYRLLYVAPERLHSDLFAARAERLPVSLLAVDEAHCVSEWGRHFRPAYQQIPEARTLLGDPPTVALTATATPEVRRDIRTMLALREPFVLVHGFDRPNIVWSVFTTANKQAHVRRILERVPGTAVVYTATRAHAEQWAARFERIGISAEAYHGGMPSEERKRVQTRWLADKTRVVVATNAFGMGIDKPDVRVVIHVDLPGSIEAYYQEAGRAGRDGRRAYAVLLFHEGDEALPARMIEASHPEASRVQRVYSAVANIGQVPMGSFPDEPVHIDEEAVERVTGLNAPQIRTAVDVLVRQGVWQIVPGRRLKGHVWFQQSAAGVRAFADTTQNRALGRFVRTLLRLVHAEAFHGWWEVDLPLLQKRTGLERERLMKGLAYLEQHGVLRWRPPGATLRVEFTEPRTQTVPIEDRHIRRARKRSERQLSHMVRYARSVGCRRRFLLGYFGERRGERCGACDVCLGRHEPVVVTGDHETQLRALLAAVEQGVDRGRWGETVGVPDDRIERLTHWLVQEEYLHFQDPLAQTLKLTDKAREFLRQWAPR